MSLSRCPMAKMCIVLLVLALGMSVCPSCCLLSRCHTTDHRSIGSSYPLGLHASCPHALCCAGGHFTRTARHNRVAKTLSDAEKERFPFAWWPRGSSSSWCQHNKKSLCWCLCMYVCASALLLAFMILHSHIVLYLCDLLLCLWCTCMWWSHTLSSHTTDN